MSDDLPNQNNNPIPAPPVGNPPPFGSNFNPHTNPVDPNNPYSSAPQTPPIPQPVFYPPQAPNSPEPSIHEEVARHRPRDAEGHFLPYEHPINPNPQPVPVASLEQTIPKQPNIFKKTFDFIIKIKWKKATLYITSFLTLAYLILSNPAVQNFINHIFPNSSPIFGRQVSFQGVLRSGEGGIYTLILPDSTSYTLHFKPSPQLTNLKKLNEVVVKGNFTWTPFVIENAEVYPLNITIPDNPVPPNIPNSP